MRPIGPITTASAIALGLAAASLSCEREDRSFRVAPPAAAAPTGVPAQDIIRAGGGQQAGASTQPVSLTRLENSPYKHLYPENATAMSDGQTWYEAYNCVGCHAHGGGGMGPPLMDDKWFYGGEPEQVYASIVQGRPNGMPSFRGRIPDYQVWEIVAYVRSLSGHSNKIATPGREDHMRGPEPSNSTPTEPIKRVPDATATPP